MVEISVPGCAKLRLEHLVCDVNGTLAQDGVLLEGVNERIIQLKEKMTVHLLSAATRPGLEAIENALGLKAQRIVTGEEAEQKAAYVERLGVESCVALGNGSNDARMLAKSALSIAVLGPEGLSREALMACDLVVPEINLALDLILAPLRIVATLRR